MGSAIFTIISAVAQLERDIIRERVKMGLRRAKENGKRTSLDIDAATRLRRKGMGLRQIAEKLGSSKSTVARVLAEVSH